MALSTSAYAQGLAVSPPGCTTNPGAVVSNSPSTSGVAVSGATDCPPGTSPSAQVNDAGGIAIGNDRTNPTTTQGNGGSVAIGNGARGGAAGASNAVALGTNAQAIATSATALGSASSARAANSVAVGGGNAISAGSIAIGQGAVTGFTGDATRINQVAIGLNAAATAQNAIAIGDAAVANGVQATALGSNANAGTNATAVGRSAIAGNSAVAYGVNANAGLRATALGQGAVASAQDSTAIGSFASATADNSVALGRQSSATRGAQTNYIGYGLAARQNSIGEVAIGTPGGARQLTGVAAGSAATDAVNVSQLTAIDAQADLLGSNLATLLGGGAAYNSATGALSTPSYSVQGTARAGVGTAITALDTQVTTNRTNITSLTNGTAGLVRQATTTSGLTVAAATGGTTVAFAGTSGARRLTGVAAGTVAASSTEAVNGGQLSGTAQSLATGLGGGATLSPTGIVSAPVYTIQGTARTGVGTALTALDTQTTTNGINITNLTNGTAGLLRQATTTSGLTVAAATGGTTVAFAGTSGARRLTGVAAGTVSTTSTEAVNGGQLSGTAQSIAAGFGGGATLSSTGTISAPVYIIQGTARTGVGTALTALDTQATTNRNNIANLSNGTAGLVRQATTTSGVTIAATTGGTAVSILGTSGTRRLTGVAAGTVSTSSTEAVNGGQLQGTAQSIATGLGGGATVAANGTLSAPVYRIQGANRTGVSGALTALDTQTTANTANITGLTAAVNGSSAGLVRQSSSTAGVTVGATTGGTTVSFTGTSGARRLTGVAAGTISAASSEAINGAQLHASNTSLANALGGGSMVAANGTVTAPAYRIQGATLTNVGAALTTLDTQVTANSANIAGLTQAVSSGSIGLVRQASPGAPLTVGATTDGDMIDVTGTSGARRLAGVAAGTVSEASSEAITGAQLHAGSTSLANALGGGSTVAANGTVTGPAYRIQGATLNNVGVALTALDTEVTSNNANIAGLTEAVSSGTIGLLRQASPGAPLTVGAMTDGDMIDLTGTSGERRLTGVGEGAISTTSLDAINGSQLAATNGAVQTVANSVAAQAVRGFTSNAAGAVAPVANGADTAAGGSGAAASGAQATAVGVDSRASSDQATAIGAAASASGTNSVAIGANSDDAGEANVISVGSANAGRRITNVAMGFNQTDAVNVGQLSTALSRSLASANAYTDARFAEMSFDLDEVRRDGEGATASSMALAGIPQSFERGMGMVGMGVGTWQGESAVAVGISKAADSGQVVFKAGATYSSRGQGGANGGVGFAF